MDRRFDTVGQRRRRLFLFLHPGSRSPDMAGRLTIPVSIRMAGTYVMYVTFTSHVRHLTYMNQNQIRRPIAEILLDLLAYIMKIWYLRQIPLTHRPHRL